MNRETSTRTRRSIKIHLMAEVRSLGNSHRSLTGPCTHSFTTNPCPTSIQSFFKRFCISFALFRIFSYQILLYGLSTGTMISLLASVILLFLSLPVKSGMSVFPRIKFPIEYVCFTPREELFQVSYTPCRIFDSDFEEHSLTQAYRRSFCDPCGYL